MNERYGYEYQPKQDRRVSSLVTTTKTDCGGGAALLVGTLRANGIPARMLAGRRIRPQNSREPAFHVIAEFHVDGIGWVPLEAVFGNKPYWANHFGADCDDFFVTHIDSDLTITVPDVWIGTTALLQEELVFVRGTGSTAGKVKKVVWGGRFLR